MVLPETKPDAKLARSERKDLIIELYKPGVDRTLLRENLKLTPTERVLELVAAQQFAIGCMKASRR
jgi:hypothetical protein